MANSIWLAPNGLTFNQVNFADGSFLASYANGKVKLIPVSGSTTPVFAFGGVTNAFPALRRNGTGLEVVLGDESAYGPLTASLVNFGTPGSGIIQGAANAGATGLTAADTNRINYTPISAAPQSFMLQGVIDVTAWATPASFTVVATYKDASGNACTDTAQLVRGSTGGAAAAITAVDRWYYEFPCIDIDASGAHITVSTTGTFTGTPVYNHAAILYRIR